MKAKMTVIILTYNRAEMLNRAVDSVLAQSFQEYELLLINNGSTDNTSSICNAYAEKNNSVRVYTLPVNQGISAARNFAFSLMMTILSNRICSHIFMAWCRIFRPILRSPAV